MCTLWQILPAIAAVIAGGCIFAFSKDVRRFHKYMGFSLIFEGLWMVLACSVRYGSVDFSASLYVLSIAMMLVAPFFYFISCRYLLKEEGVRRNDLWLLVTVGVFLAALAVGLRCTGELDRFLFINLLGGVEIDSVPVGTRLLVSMDNLALILFFAESAFAVAFCFAGFRKYSSKIENYYSSTAGKSIRQITILFILVGVKLAVLAAMVFIPGLAVNSLLLIIKAFLDLMFYAAAAYLSIKTRFTSEELVAAQKASDTKPKKPAAADAIEEQLGKLIEEEFFLDPDIDIFTLSDRMQINSKYVADFIRYKYKESFMVFVNRLRVEHSIELMKNPELSLQAVSDDSGFITPSTYYRNFIKIMGVSPSEYRKKM